MLRIVEYIDLGKISYQDAFEIQKEAQQELVKRKIAIRDGIQSKDVELINKLFFCEHNPVYTLGKSGSIENLLLNESQLEDGGIEFYKTNRGGDITYHGPGQIVGYPIFDLDIFFHDVHKYVRLIEEVIIKTLNKFSIDSCRIDGLTGVWIKGDNGASDRKICAIGVHISRWITLHGFALNVNTDLNYFNGIVPCGIDDKDKEVTSIQQEIGKKVSLDDVKQELLKSFKEVFDVEYR